MVSRGATRVYSVLYRHQLLSDASPKTISGRTSYLPTRLEFLPYPQVIRGRFNERRFGPPVGFTPPSTCSWIDRRVSGLYHHTQSPYSDSLSLRLRFFHLNLARNHDSPVHSARGTPSHVNVLRQLVGTWFQELFHSPPGVLFTFPSRYWFTIGH